MGTKKAVGRPRKVPVVPNESSLKKDVSNRSKKRTKQAVDQGNLAAHSQVEKKKSGDTHSSPLTKKLQEQLKQTKCDEVLNFDKVKDIINEGKTRKNLKPSWRKLIAECMNEDETF